MIEAAVKTESTVSSKLLVTGMDCPDCAAKVEKAVKRMQGVIKATVVFPAGRLNVEYDPQQTGITQMIDKIKKLGYEAREDNQKISSVSQTTDFCIIGMDCADCAAKLEKRISKVPGVEAAHVNLGTSKMTVIHSGPMAEILSTIEKMGYSGKVDEGLRIKSEPDSFWKSNQYAKPTVISFIMLVLGFTAGKLGAPELAVNGLFLTGIILGGFLPAKNGISVLINAWEFDMNLLMTIAVIGASAIGSFEEAASVVFLFSFGNALQGYTLDKTRNSIRALMEITPNEALVRRGTTEMTSTSGKNRSWGYHYRSSWRKNCYGWQSLYWLFYCK